MRSLEDNLFILNEVLVDLETFILSKDLFWRLMGRFPSGKRLPKISLGGIQLLLDQMFVQQKKMNQEQAARYQELLEQWQHFSEKWVSAIAVKATREIGMRLSLWKGYLNETGDIGRELSHSVHHRVMLSRLAEFLPQALLSDEIITKLQALEIPHRIFTVGGDFIWDDELKAAYSRDDFPFLYVKPRKIEPHQS